MRLPVHVFGYAQAPYKSTVKKTVKTVVFRKAKHNNFFLYSSTVDERSKAGVGTVECNASNLVSRLHKVAAGT